MRTGMNTEYIGSPKPESFSNHETAHDSGNRLFRDSKNQLFIITDEGWIDGGFIEWPESWPEYPVTAPNDERLVIQNGVD